MEQDIINIFYKFGLQVVKLTQIPRQCLAKQMRATPEALGQDSPSHLC